MPRQKRCRLSNAHWPTPNFHPGRRKKMRAMMAGLESGLRRRRPWQPAPTRNRPKFAFPSSSTPDGPVSSPEKLKQLAQLESVPEAIETIQIQRGGPEKKVTICHINFDERDKIEEKAEVIDGSFNNIIVRFRGGKWYALVVKELKEGITLEETEQSGKASGD
ncbi:hypothetical protein VTI74DRAFT_7835 [Chaetomium olivicolor]